MLRDRLTQCLPRLANARVLVIGDVMLDHYLVGAVNRISPEAPVPVVKVASEHLLLGGAGNVASNIRRLGGQPYLVSVSGDDDNASNLGLLLRQEGIEACIVRSDDRPTTIKTRLIAQNQQMARIDKEQDAPIDDRALDLLLESIAEALPTHEVVIISDYGKGVVQARFMERFRELCQRLQVSPKVLVDPKIRNFHLYQNVFCITPNTTETRQAAGVLEVNTRQDILLAGLAIFKKTKCEHLLVTLGPNGMAFFDKPSLVLHIPTIAKRVFDVTGAGDTVIATLGQCLAAGLPLLESAILANYAAGVVVGEVGTASCSPQDLLRAVQTLPEPAIEPWLQGDVA